MAVRFIAGRMYKLWKVLANHGKPRKQWTSLDQTGEKAVEALNYFFAPDGEDEWNQPAWFAKGDENEFGNYKKFTVHFGKTAPGVPRRGFRGKQITHGDLSSCVVAFLQLYRTDGFVPAGDILDRVFIKKGTTLSTGRKTKIVEVDEEELADLLGKVYPLVPKLNVTHHLPLVSPRYTFLDKTASPLNRSAVEDDEAVEAIIGLTVSSSMLFHERVAAVAVASRPRSTNALRRT